MPRSELRKAFKRLIFDRLERIDSLASIQKVTWQEIFLCTNPTTIHGVTIMENIQNGFLAFQNTSSVLDSI